MVLLSQEGGNLCAKTDKDQDGQYETVVAVGKAVDPRDPLGGSGSFFSQHRGLIFGVAGGLLAAVLLVTAIVVIKKKKSKKKVKHEFEEPF